MLEQIEDQCHGGLDEAEESGRQRSNEFQAKAKAVAGADDGGHPRVNRSIELDLKQISWIQQDTRIEHHATLAYFGAPAENDGGRKAFGSDHPNRQVNGHPIPSPRVIET
jgi:hypothetical protein